MSDAIKELEIGNRKYVTVLMPPIRAVALHARLLSMLGGAVSKIAPSDMKDKDQAVSVISGALQGIDEKKLPTLIVDMVSNVSIGGEKIDNKNFDSHFTAHPSDIYPLASWVIWVNVKDFLAQSGAGWSSLIKAVGLKSLKIDESSIS